MDSSNPFFMNSTPQLTAAVAMQVAIQAAQQAQNQRLKAHVWLELAKKLGLSPAFYGIDPTTGRLVVGGNPIRMAAFEVNGGKGPIHKSVLKGVLSGVWTTIVGIASTVGGIALLTPPAEAATLGTDTPLGIAGVLNGVTQIGLGVTKIVSSLTGGPSSIPASNGDVLAIGTGSSIAGAIYDIGTGGNPLKKLKNIWDSIGQLDTAKTVVQTIYGGH